MPSPSPLAAQAARALAARFASVLSLPEEAAALVLWDPDCALARAVAEAYRVALPEATSLDFRRTALTSILTGFELLRAGDLVVFVQSVRFEANLTEARAELMARGVRLVEHAELAGLEAGDPEGCLRLLARDPSAAAGEELIGYLTAAAESGP